MPFQCDVVACDTHITDCLASLAAEEITQNGDPSCSLTVGSCQALGEPLFRVDAVEVLQNDGGPIKGQQTIAEARIRVFEVTSGVPRLDR